MTQGELPDHALETFKSLIQITVEGLKMLALLNGGAAVALLAYLGNVAGKSTYVPDMRWPMGLFVLGLFLCGLAFAGSYVTQLNLFNESMGRSPKGRHQRFLWGTLLVGLGSLLAFGAGAFVAALRFPSD